MLDKLDEFVIMKDELLNSLIHGGTPNALLNRTRHKTYKNTKPYRQVTNHASRTSQRC